MIMAVSTAQAAVKITQKDVDVNNRCLKLSGETDVVGEVVSVNIPACEMTASDLESAQTPGDYIFYSNELICNENGVFSVQIDFPTGAKEGKYTVYLGGKAVGAAESFSVWFAEKSTFESEIANLNDIAENGSYQEFKSELEQNGWKAGLADETVTEGNDILVNIVYNYAKNTGLSEDSTVNTSMYNTALAAQLLSEGKVSEAEKIMPVMLISDKGVLEDYNTYIKENEEKEYFSEMFEDCSTLAEFEDSFLDAIILTVVKFSDGTSDIKEIFSKYDEYLGVEISKAGPDDYSYISGESYESVERLVQSFNDRVKSSANAGSQGGSGGGGSGGSGGGSSSNLGAILNSGNSIINTTTPEEIDIKFEDLNPVPWAYTAISNLFSNGIIHGRSETKFAPNEPVKREEFVKMLVEMAGIEVLDYENVFADVDENAWYAKYVNSAYKNGICNGKDDGSFGIGNNISREDMCVMAYNTLSNKNSLSLGENSFADENEFSEYAKEPVRALNAAGIVNGVGDGKFNPKGNATRAEAAVIIFNTLCYIRK